MGYKEHLGGHCVDRRQFLTMFRNAREKVSKFFRFIEMLFFVAYGGLDD